MIKYALRCEHGHEFEGWFRNSEDCDVQAHEGHLQCPYCGSSDVAKSLMTPRVTTSRNKAVAKAGNDGMPVVSQVPAETASGAPDPKKMQEMLRSIRDHVINSADYVGDKFAEEARKMHFKEKEQRGIYGEASTDEVRSLAEDGIECLPLPRLPEDQN